MFHSFTTKLGTLLLTLTLTLVVALLGYFHYFTQTNLLSDLKMAIGDVTRTASYVFNEEERAWLKSLKANVLERVPNDTEKSIAALNQQGEGETQRLFSVKDSNELEASLEFQYIVQLLRRIQAGSREQQSALSFLSQTNIQSENPSRVAWAYLLVRVPGQTSNKTLMFLADSNYEVDSVSPQGNPVGNLYRAAAFFFEPFKGKMGIADDWYTDEFGTVISAAVPIFDDNGSVLAVLGIDYDVASFEDRINQQTWVGLGLLVAAILFAVIMTSIIVLAVSVPLSKLKEGAQQLSNNNFGFRVQLKSNDEFGLLANSMNKVSIALDEYTRHMDSLVAAKTSEMERANQQVVALNEKLAAENQALGGEIEDMRELRGKHVADAQFTFQGHDVDVGVILGKRCGGEFWASNQHKDHEAIYFGALSGYGIEVASQVLQTQSILSRLPSEDVLNMVNQLLYDYFESCSSGGLAHLLSIRIVNNKIALRGSGGPVLIASSDNETKVLEFTDNQPCGIDPKWVIKAGYDVELMQGHRLLLLSDGCLSALMRLTEYETSLDANRIVEVLDKYGGTVASLMKVLREQSWIDDFDNDICAMQIQVSAKVG